MTTTPKREEERIAYLDYKLRKIEVEKTKKVKMFVSDKDGKNLMERMIELPEKLANELLDPQELSKLEGE